MITFIICSVRPADSARVAGNIRATSGIADPEIFIHDNREPGWGLCRVYNHYAGKASNDYLCFVHEDFFFRTEAWAPKIVDFYRRTPDAGIVGFFGYQIKTQTPSIMGGLKRYERSSIYSHVGGGRVIPLLNKGDSPGDFSPVVLVDGQCMIVPKKVWAGHRFDEERFSDFHMYDIDFSLQVAGDHKNYICHSVVGEHLSVGSYNEHWFRNVRLLHEKWNDRLPLTAVPMSRRQIRAAETFAAYKLYKRILSEGRTDEVAFTRTMYLRRRTLWADLRLMRHRKKYRKIMRGR